MRLTVIGRYRNGPLAYEVGQVLDVTDAVGELLMRDSPGSFVVGAAAPPVAASETLGTGTPTVDRRARGGLRR